MVVGGAQERARTRTGSNLGATVLHDLQTAEIRRTLRRDFQELYTFYLDDERRARLATMNRVQRVVLVVAWLLKSVFLDLSPVRRLLVLLACAGFVVERISLRTQSLDIDVSLLPPSFVALLVVLMLELKDKLLAHDELAVGRQVQLALLPRAHPALPGWSIWMYTRPANDVGGDLVDYLPVGDDGLGLMLGDVAGKGLGAALLMAKLQATLRALAPECATLGELGARTNAILARDGLPNRFATLVYAEIEAGRGEVRMLNAGHLPVYVVGGRGLVSYPATAVPLGIVPLAEFFEQRVVLEEGDLLVICSDGVTEARSAVGEFYGDERVRALLRAVDRTTDAPVVGERLRAAVESFSADAPQSDDLSLVVIRRGEPLPVPDGARRNP